MDKSKVATIFEEVVKEYRKAAFQVAELDKDSYAASVLTAELKILGWKRSLEAELGGARENVSGQMNVFVGK